MSGNTITIFDTTLRDGEQSPGCSMTTDEKLEVARALVELGVDVIEAGFPIASPGDFEAVKRIAQEFGSRTMICGLARCRKDDIDRAAEALKHAEKARMHVFLATSKIHMEHKLKMTPSEIVAVAVEMVKRAVDHIPNVEFSPEDAARTELNFLCEVVEKAIDAGATTINIPDTVGYATPQQFYNVIRHLKTHVPNIEKAVISTHCHNDLGLAVANSLAGVEAGARQIECTINGLGERAGNAALEEIVMALRTRADHYKVETKINTPKLFSMSRLVSRITGMMVQRNKAIVGQNAFAHEAGIHQHGILQERSTYEIMRPEDVGYVGANLVLGKHSGRHALRDRVRHLGFTVTDGDFERIYNDLMTLADKKKEIFDSDIVALIENLTGGSRDEWELIKFHTNAGTDVVPTATIEMKRTGSDEVIRGESSGDGPVDAVFCAIERVCGVSGKLAEYVVRNVSSGKDAQGEATVALEVDGRTYHGRGLSTDVVAASANAYLKAINHAVAAQQASSK